MKINNSKVSDNCTHIPYRGYDEKNPLTSTLTGKKPTHSNVHDRMLKVKDPQTSNSRKKTTHHPVSAPYSHEKQSDDTLVLPRHLRLSERKYDAFLNLIHLPTPLKTSHSTCFVPKQANTLASFQHPHTKHFQLLESEGQKYKTALILMCQKHVLPLPP